MEGLTVVNLLSGRFGISVLVSHIFIYQLPFVTKCNLHAFVQIGKFPKAGSQGIIAIDCSLNENLRIRMESDDGTGIV